MKREIRCPVEKGGRTCRKLVAYLQEPTEHDRGYIEAVYYEDSYPLPSVDSGTPDFIPSWDVYCPKHGLILEIPFEGMMEPGGTPQLIWKPQTVETRHKALYDKR